MDGSERIVWTATSRRSALPFLVALVLLFAGTLHGEVEPTLKSFNFDGSWSSSWSLEEGETLELGIRIATPSSLPPNARIEVTWDGPDIDSRAEDRKDHRVRATTDWTKVLHALDPDVLTVYRAPVSGTYALRLATLKDRQQPLGPIPHDTGRAPLANPLPAITPSVDGVELQVEIRPIEALSGNGLVLEAEPNDSPEQAINLALPSEDGRSELHVIAGADDLEYYNNTATGTTPDDWYRIEYRGSEATYFSANLQIIEPVVSARIRFYKRGTPSTEEMQERDQPNSRDFANFNPVPYVHPPATVIPGPVPVYTYEEGRAINERAHQQDRSFRTFVTRRLDPGEIYYLRVEANQPHYEMHVRIFDPAPYEDPVEAVRQGIYYHLAEIDAWLIHRPRNIALHRRVRDATALFGENCMSCHTQSGVWGVADAFRYGYGPKGVEQNYRRLVNTMYESLRLTNELKDAAVNTSVAPNDLGDGPAGTRVAGRNIVLHERTFQPKEAHRQWQQRTANYVLQTADPKGINAAGRGSNFGFNVVFKFAAEVLERAWRDTGEPRYFFGLEEKGRKILATGDTVRVTDDYGHRIEFVHRIWPADYVDQVRRLTHSARRIAEAERLDASLRERARIDIERLLTLQQDDGGWGFKFGQADDEGRWQRPDDHSYPAATAVALIALEAAGFGSDHPVVRKGVQWMLANQYPYGIWNAAAQTGFVTSAYALRALSRLHPAPKAGDSPELRLSEDASVIETLSILRSAQATGDVKYAPLFHEAVRSEDPRLRLYGLLGLGGSMDQTGVPTLIDHLDDPVKACREAAFWSLRQLLLDGAGWREILEAFNQGSDRARQSVMQALVTRAHLAGMEADIDMPALVSSLTAGMVDSHPGVRAFAFKAAWHWWVWNPPMREALNQAWMDALLRPEPEAHVDMALRYTTISLFVVNGQVNNITGGKYLRQQYPELSTLFNDLATWRQTADAEQRLFVDRRLTAMAASHYMERANQQSPGQFAYSTPGATELFGKAVHAVYGNAQDDPGHIPWRSIALEGARNITYEPLQTEMLELVRSADPEVVAIAARALSNPGSLSLPATPAVLEPLLQMLQQYAHEGREKDADAVANFLARIRWDFEGLSPQAETLFYESLLGAKADTRAGVLPVSATLAGKPAPNSTAGLDDVDYAPLLAKILGENRTLQRKEAFRHLSGNARLWLDSTEWMLAFREGSASLEEAVEGATEAEDLAVQELTFGRTTEQMIADGVASGNTILLWEEGKVGAHVSFGIEVPEDGRYELLAAFLYGASHGIVDISLDDRTVLETADFYRPDVSSTGPTSLGVFDLEAGQRLLTVKMVGTSPEAEPEYKFGLDYVKLAPHAEGQAAGDQDVGTRDPIVEGKRRVLSMFVDWFDADAPLALRNQASRLATKPALRRNPEVRRAIGEYVNDEPDRAIRARLRNLLSNDDESYGRQLQTLIASIEPDSTSRRLEPTEEFVKDILHFRDYVFPEMNAVSSRDDRACISCHGVPGRVPTLYLHPPDDGGYIPANELLTNYRKIQERVDAEDPDRSLFLRKPLNEQTGQEEGHQGGLRYVPEDQGYQILRDWVVRQAALQAVH